MKKVNLSFNDESTKGLLSGVSKLAEEFIRQQDSK